MRAAMLACAAACAAAVHATVPSTGDECFWSVAVSGGERVTGSFEVLSGGMRDVDATLFNSAGTAVYAVTRQSRGSFAASASSEGGAFRLCFSNRLSSQAEKSVAFALHAGGESGAAPASLRDVATKEHVSALDREVASLVEAVSAIEDEQRYVWARERAARDLNEATNASVARWSLLELVTMVAIGLAQAWAMKNYFETRQRF